MIRQKAEVEASALRNKAELEASLHVLTTQKMAAAAEAEAAAYEEEEVESGEKHEPYVPGKPLNASERAGNYVQQHSDMFGRQPAPPTHAPLHSYRPVAHAAEPAAHHSPTPLISKMKQEQSSPYKSPMMPPQPPPHKGFLPIPQPYPSLHRGPSSEPQPAQDLAKYLMRREMVSSGLLHFDDRPEHFWSWKASFLSATQDLNLTPREELDLLVKWLGADSAEQAQRIRSVRVFDPAAGLRMVWQRVEECYGAPEAVEHALLKKIEDFPKLTNKDNAKLRELGDILLELECAKEEGYLPGLAFLDTARGVNPIVEKLSYSLQERWISIGSRYKEENGVAFPPFSIFSQFVRRQAKVRNDPSFAFSTSNSNMPPKGERSVKHSYKTPVSVHKTEVTPKPSYGDTSSVEKRIGDPDRECPIHRKPHPLKRCRTFRSKAIEERKAYLKENRICFKCCGSTQHMAKDCRVPIKCAECNSERHIAALHPGPPVFNDSAVTEKEESGEPDEDTPAVTSKCTEICGNADSPRSCAKICLVKAYPAGRKEKAVKMYAVLDEQSNKSLAKTEFFNLFGLKASPAPYTLKTCAGTTETSGRRVNNFTLESMDGKLQLPLPTLIECDMVPDDRFEIPSPDIAKHHPHLQRVAQRILDVDPNAPILLLLGRDILRVHKVREQVNGPHNAPYAQRLDLGWVIVGDVCLGTVHKPAEVNVYKANVLQNGRTSFLHPCPNNIQVKEIYSNTPQRHNPRSLPCDEEAGWAASTDSLSLSVFESSRDDNKPALSMDDKVFLTIMDREVYQDDAHSWVAPLPFRSPRQPLPSNREQAFKRLGSLRRTREKKPYTRRGILSTVNSLYDPLGFVAPIVMQGKALVRELSSEQGWDTPLDPGKETEWNTWRESLTALEDLHIKRVIRIRRSTHPDQWSYVPTDQNPADHATRYMPAAQLQQSIWHSGPSFLTRNNTEETWEPHIFTLLEPDADTEIRPEVTALATRASDTRLGSQRFRKILKLEKPLQCYSQTHPRRCIFQGKSSQRRSQRLEQVQRHTHHNRAGTGKVPDPSCYAA
ncbi:hypothetical protein PBY51_014653 [Eleginops maclovinus]|uniref:CCHC-type domain-containing protein n=1 Tax=Eleginops maclovinus TaxID=56733 RepID=A0AAN7X2P4_ELEMC|nr:hypothetical protein PBY51_014653 [Eleginops maclovinus]